MFPVSRRVLLGAVLLATSLALGCGPGPNTPVPVLVQVLHIVTRDGIPGALVQMTTTVDDETETLEGTTNGAGEVELNPLPGDWTVVVSKNGISSASQSVTIERGESRTLTFLVDLSP